MSHSVPLAGETGNGAGVNRRATIRYQCTPAAPGRVYLEDDDHEYQRAWVLDLSSHGIGMRLSRPLKTGTFLVVQIKTAILKPFQLTAQVVHATALPSGDWQVGCEFISPLADEELQDLLQ